MAIEPHMGDVLMGVGEDLTLTRYPTADEIKEFGTTVDTQMRRNFQQLVKNKPLAPKAFTGPAPRKIVKDGEVYKVVENLEDNVVVTPTKRPAPSSNVRALERHQTRAETPPPAPRVFKRRAPAPGNAGVDVSDDKIKQDVHESDCPTRWRTVLRVMMKALDGKWPHMSVAIGGAVLKEVDILVPYSTKLEESDKVHMAIVSEKMHKDYNVPVKELDSFIEKAFTLMEKQVEKISTMLPKQ